ncbi:pyrimidine-nucleoside phosphorylase [Alteribacillus iranensis]|uniref:Pyrimidine-nucleoside phosphorylase n=1 Tax=Alteribacillus iranensis TaxID=930128 RepID=A0A1I1ZNW6_9BACI|nr:pyrimidine-nucleoside phosphorylase [Alteribacillus iranensis]SFE32253.1 pyrimidine-nucleoside phosphorylase [Alteribacillus iranensis]
MRMPDIIAKKRDGERLSESEIRWFIDGYTKDSIPDYQVSALLMAIYFQGMTQEEASVLTRAMAESGEQLDLSSIEGIKVDKHSTGGVGDKTTLILAPLVAALGIPVAKMSGRGLGHTGGTIDKLEAFTGFQTEISQKKFIELVNTHKLALAGQSGNLTPADKKLYSLRDVTATVNSTPLIASSVMSKKIAAGADAIVLDVKAGSGAFMSTVEEAAELAESMVGIGKSLNRRTMALITNMDQPLGRMIGNTLEVKESLDVLRGEGPEDIYELSVLLAAHMAVLGGKVTEPEEGRRLIEDAIRSGAALEKMREFIGNQGGDPTMVDRPDLLKEAEYKIEVKATSTGYVRKMETELIGRAAMWLGAGRSTKTDTIDHSVGIELKKKVGEKVEMGEPLAVLHSNTLQPTEAKKLVEEAYSLTGQPVEKPELVHGTIY